MCVHLCILCGACIHLPLSKGTRHASVTLTRRASPAHLATPSQAALPFKTKPKLEAARKRKSLEQKRAVVVEGAERKAVSVLAQLNAIRNSTAAVRREHVSKKRQEHKRKMEQENAWRKDWNKEQRKRRYVEQGRQERANAKRSKQDA